MTSQKPHLSNENSNDSVSPSTPKGPPKTIFIVLGVCGIGAIFITGVLALFAMFIFTATSEYRKQMNDARLHARSIMSENNMTIIGIGLEQQNDLGKSWPASYSIDADGNPLLSWRVHILPYIDQVELYEQFHLNEPWDSPHNKTLLTKMPSIFRSPHSTASSSHTNYLGNATADGIFVVPKNTLTPGVATDDITDGTGNTLLLLEVNDQHSVPWTRPIDFTPTGDDLQDWLRNTDLQTTHGLFADMNIASIDPENKELLSAQLTRSGNESTDQLEELGLNGE